MTGLAILADADFDAAVLAQDLPVLIDFWAPWCAACRTMTPVIEDIAQDLAAAAKVVMVDVEQAPAITARYGVTTLPTLLLVRDGDEIMRVSGLQSRARLIAMVESLL